MMEALKRSPLGAAVSAWTVDDTDFDVFVRAQQQDNHWVCIYGYEDGKYWYVFDSLRSDAQEAGVGLWLARVKRYSIKPRTSLTFAFISRAFL